MLHRTILRFFCRTECQMEVKNLSLLLLGHFRSRTQIEKEVLAIVYAVKKFYQCLFGRHFLLYTDHKPLLITVSEVKGIPSMTAARMLCKAVLLSADNYTLKYRSCSENSNADFSTRFPSNKKDSCSSVQKNIHDRIHPCPSCI